MRRRVLTSRIVMASDGAQSRFRQRCEIRCTSPTQIRLPQSRIRVWLHSRTGAAIPLTMTFRLMADGVI